MAIVEHELVVEWEDEDDDMDAKASNWCVHYNGIFRGACHAGVIYADVKGPEPGPLNYPCFRDRQCTVVCDHRRFMTEEEERTDRLRTDTSIKRFVDNLAHDICPHCEQPITHNREVGRCVYAGPCGHRLYQGSR